MAWADKITTTLFGRRFGLQTMSTSVSGSGVAGRSFDVAVGVEAVRAAVTTADTTSSNLTAYGFSLLTTAASSGVYTLDPPIPGIEKTLAFNTSGTNPIYVKTANSETVLTTQNSSGTVISSSQGAIFTLRLVGLTTALWGCLGSVSSGSLKLSTTT